MVKSRATAIVELVSRETLRGSGFVRTKPRSWYEDNGWFLSNINFQAPVGWQGSFLNVGATFLWTPGDDEMPPANSYDYAPGGNPRITVEGLPDRGRSVEYDGDDETFEDYFEIMARRGLEEGVKLRVLRDWLPAKDAVLRYRSVSEELWGNWDKAMMCFVTGDSRVTKYLNGFASFQFERNEWVQRFIAEQSAIFLPLVNDFPAAQLRIKNTIEENRQYVHDHWMPTLDTEWRFIAPPLGSIPEFPIDEPRNKRRLLERLSKRR